MTTTAQPQPTMFNGYVARVTRIRLASRAEHALSHHTYRRVTDWLTTWTTEGNFKAVVAESREACKTRLSAMLYATLLPQWLRIAGVAPELFEFQMAGEDVKDGEFWGSFRFASTTYYPVEVPTK